MVTSSELAIENFGKLQSFDGLSSKDFNIVVKHISENAFLVPIIVSKPEYSSQVIPYIFGQTKREIGIYTETLSDSFLSNPGDIDELKKCLDRNVTVNILLDRIPDPKSEVCKLLANHIKTTRRGKISLATDKSIGIIKELFTNNQSSHFVVGDEKRYIINSNDSSKPSYAHFNDFETGEQLSDELSDALTFAERLTL